MTKTIILFISLMLSSSWVWAMQEDTETPAEQAAMKEPQEPAETAPAEAPETARIKTPRTPVPSKDELINLESAFTKTRLDDLERRIVSIEREFRFLEEQVRNIDRSVDDLKRRR